MFAEGTHPGPTNQRQDFGLDLDAFLRHPRKLWRWPVGRSVGAYSLGVVSAALLSWEVTPCERCLVAVVDRLGIAGFLINQTKMMSDER